MVGARFSRASLLTNTLVLLLAVPVVVPGVEAAPVVIFEDDFNDGAPDPSKWTYVGAVESADCGAASSPRALFFGLPGVTIREATTRPLNTIGGGVIEFSIKIGTESAGSSCENVDSGEDILLEYSVDSGSTWTTISVYGSELFSSFTSITETIPAEAEGESTQFRWRQLSANTFSSTPSPADNWAIDDVVITGKEPFSSLTPPVSETIPGTSESETLPTQPLDTPPATIPATCTLGPCTSETPVGTPPVPVDRTCTPLDLVCVGPFTIPEQHVADVPAICDAAGFACIDEQNIPSQHLGDTPEITVAVDFTGLDVFADPHAGELTTIGPIEENVGGIPVTICASTCPFPVPPEGETLGSVTVTVVIDGDEHSETVSLDASV